jgi:RNA polymerase sigma-70 factor, ECF subfamily
MAERQTDEQLMQSVAAGSGRALDSLMQRWRGSVWCFIDRMCRRDDTDDLYQEVWTRLYRYRKRYKPSKPFRPYLFAIVVNTCRSALRRQEPWVLESLGDSDPLPDPVEDGDPLTRAIRKEQSAALRRAIHRLPRAQREVMLLYLICSSDHHMIASALGKRPASVRTTMHRALQRLRSTLQYFTTPSREVHHETQSNPTTG